ncbi:TRAF3-interacting protein 1 [Pelodytes ibericus]
METGVIRRTQESLGKVIRKPPLTDKLLGKPPFRYLHDILTEVIRTTGFLKGLYTESELKSDNVKDKDAKISFLQKAIDVVLIVTGEPLAVKPARVVAGHEPERTNELLQAIGKCCLNKLSSDDAVKRVLAGEKPDLKGKPPASSKSQDKENREAKDEERRNHREKEDRKETEIRERSGSRERKDRQRKEDERKHSERDRERKKESDQERVTETERDGLREGDKNDKEKSRGRETRSETEKDRSKEKSGREKGRERRSEGSRGKEREKDREKDRTKDREKGREKDRHQERERNKERDPEQERRKERVQVGETQKARDEERLQEPERPERKHKGPEETTKKASEVSAKESRSAVDKEISNSTKNSRPSASKLRERRPAKSGGEGDTGSDHEVGATQSLTPENSDILDGQQIPTPLRKIPRPGSARPAPPRVRRQGSTETPVLERVSSGKPISNVIVEKQKKTDDDDDDEEFIVEEASPHPPDMPEIELDSELNLTGDEKHGILVKKILETKKDYEKQPDVVNKDKILLSDAGRKKEKDLVTREIEKLRSFIQTLCRSALPLGKTMDYIQEDMDTMQNELQVWRRENHQHAKVLLREQSVTDTAVEPLKAELVELEQLIKEQQDKICTMKGNILRNQEKIQKMIQSSNVSTKV